MARTKCGRCDERVGMVKERLKRKDTDDQSIDAEPVTYAGNDLMPNDKVKRLVRHVMIDQGYGPAEYWVRAKVIDSQMCRDLFDDNKQNEQLLVEIPGGERVWVAFWQELPNDKDERGA